MKIRLWLVLSLLVSGVTWLYGSRILKPWNDYIGTRDGSLKAQMWDLYPRWVGTRELLLNGRNPYGPEVSHEIQMAFYGHIITQDYRDTSRKIVDEQRFAYPVYVIFLMAPTIYLDFAEIQRWAPTVLALFAALSVPLCLDFLGWHLRGEAIAAITLFTISSPQIVQGMRHQQLSIVVGLFLIAGAWCLRRSHLLAAGALLAWSTIKPQMALFPLCFFLIWVIGDWHRRWKLLAGFLATLVALIGVGEWLLPGWIGYFIEGAMAYRHYFPATSLLRMMLGEIFGELIAAMIVAALLVLAWRNRRSTADSREFINGFAGFLIGTILVFPLFIPFNQVLLILPAMLVVQDWKYLSRFSRITFAFCVSWPWIASSAMLIFPPRLDSPKEWPLLPLLLVSFFPLLLPVALMSRRRNRIAAQPIIAESQ
jgi:hypothetical protein